MAETHRLLNPRKILVKDLNEILTCSLCGGYLIDATTVVDCSHTFCRACIVRHFESSRLCPNCGSLVHKNKPLSKLRSDTTLQSLIYKVIPSLYNKELQRRADFYHSTDFRSNSACSDDSVLGDRSLDSEEWVISNVGDPSLYFSPDDSISLSIEYYQPETSSETIKSELKIDKLNGDNTDLKSSEISEKTVEKINDKIDNAEKIDNIVNISESDKNSCDFASDKRFLQCPAAVRMSHLMKFLRMKFALSNEHRVDIIYDEEVLPPYLSLMDVAYTFKWKRDAPMRFFYLIYIPVAKTVVPLQSEPLTTTITTTETTTTTTIPATTVTPPTPTIPPLKIEIPNNNIKTDNNEIIKTNEPASKKHNKELKLKQDKPEVPQITDELKKEDNNNLKINSKPVKPSESKSHQKTVKFSNIEYKVKNNDSLPSGITDNCVYEYAEPDKDEIKAFAERRDREWALQKYQDSEIHVSKKRKKSKHSKNEFMHKKRKLHAEITNEISSKSDDSLKLKVKLSVPNGHKHKHRNNSNSSSSSTNVDTSKTPELSPKERLLQMRQVRHKHISPVNEEKKPEPNIKVVLSPIPEKSTEKTETPEVTKSPEGTSKPPEQQPQQPIKQAQQQQQQQQQRTPDILTTGKTLRSDFSFKTSISKDICNKYVRVNLEKCAENKNNTIKKSPNKTEEKVVKNEINNKTEIFPIENNKQTNNKLNTNNKIIDTKIFNNKIENKPNSSTQTSEKTIENNKTIVKPNEIKTDESKKKNNDNNKPIETNKTIINNTKSPIDESKTIENKLNNITSQSSSLVTKNFTVSKVETGVKRKLETTSSENDKRPSLEITVINLVSRPPQTSSIQTNAVQTKPCTNTITTKSGVSITPEGPPVKKIRPPPLTIPLGRIQKMNNLKANSIVQKSQEKCDIFGALDLSAKPNTGVKSDVKINHEFRSHSASPKPKIQDQIQSMIRPKTPIKTNQDVKSDGSKTLEKMTRPNISNLQMLSESAVQIREMMAKGSPISSIPNLIKKLPNPSNSNFKTSDFLQKNPNFQKTPNLIPKTQSNNQIPKNLNNFTSKNPQFLSKNLQKLPKLHEISKNQFGRLNTNQQIRSPRPAGQNQTVRNIPNPSLLVRQQNQNRINSLNSTTPQTKSEIQTQNDAIKINCKTESSEPERKSEKTSEPPPLKPIESFKK